MQLDFHHGLLAAWFGIPQHAARGFSTTG